jgi:rhodanese-related sulfurtransferase
MPIDISARQLRELLEQQVQLVEVLPAGEYEEEHLPGAINIPLKSFTSENLSQLDRYKPVVVYCWDDN